MATTRERREITDGLERFLRWTTLVTFRPGSKAHPDDFKGIATVDRFVVGLAQQLENWNIDDHRLTAFLVFEASMHDDEPIPTSSNRWWSPSVAAQHLFGLGDYKLTQLSRPISDGGKPLKSYVDEYNKQVERTKPLSVVDPLAEDGWTTRQIIASGESGLGNQRQSFQVGKERLRVVASVLFDNLEALMKVANTDDLARILSKWEVRSAAAIESRKDKGSDSDEAGGEGPTLVTGGLMSNHHHDYERLLDRRVILFTSSVSQQIIEFNTRVIRVLAPSLSRIVLSRVSTTNADLPELHRIGQTAVRAINMHKTVIDGNTGYTWDLEVTFPATSQARTRTLEWISITTLPEGWRSSTGGHAMWIGTQYDTEQAEIAVTFDSTDMPNEVEAFWDIDAKDVGKRQYPSSNVEVGILASGGPAVEREWTNLRPGRAYGLTAIWTPSHRSE